MGVLQQPQRPYARLPLGPQCVREDVVDLGQHARAGRRHLVAHRSTVAPPATTPGPVSRIRNGHHAPVCRHSPTRRPPTSSLPGAARTRGGRGGRSAWPAAARHHRHRRPARTGRRTTAGRPPGAGGRGPAGARRTAGPCRMGAAWKCMNL
uniref:Uncharacterized protein n=1 Tax=Streptomyces sp. FR1 TaxID=349971 RepID=V9Z759_9ACTN|nr:hypothetical protein pFRL3_449c [Streptomyces sp. FR1]